MLGEVKELQAKQLKAITKRLFEILTRPKFCEHFTACCFFIVFLL